MINENKTFFKKLLNRDEFKCDYFENYLDEFEYIKEEMFNVTF